MTARIRTICGFLSRTDTFADVGCDHGYCTQYMLENGLCARAYISDVSRESLNKAERLLEKHIAAGRCIPVCASGLDGIKEPCSLVLIAGMGGEEIISILSGHKLPAKFVLQPMKNADKVRRFLIGRGAKITCDYTFEDGKFYDLIAGEDGGGDEYSDYELAFGRDNLKKPSEAFLKKIRMEAEKLKKALQSTASHVGRAEILGRLSMTEEVTDAIEGDI